MSQRTDGPIADSQAKAAVAQSFRIQLPLLIATLCFLTGCSTAEKPMAEAPPTQVTAQADQPQQVTKLPQSQVAPHVNEVQQAVKRVFKESVLIDTGRQPSFTVGDFNGDLSQDIAVVLKPVPDKLSDLNQEFPSWILRDLSGSIETDGPRLRVTAHDVLLAVIHGYGPDGWRAQEATQTFLLKNAAGSRLAVQSAKDFAAANKGRKLPQLHGDVIGEEVGGTSGSLYYAGATYSWYDSRTFKGDSPDRGMVHTAHREKSKK
ncbi:MAG: hypothetical protein AABN95_04935 [Acidobacteriota bacterium]